MATWVYPELADLGLDDCAEPVYPVEPVGKVKGDPGPYENNTVWTVGGPKPNDWGSIELTSSVSVGQDANARDDFFVTAKSFDQGLTIDLSTHFLTEVDGMDSHGFRRCF